jgi:hypothetical protein
MPTMISQVIQKKRTSVVEQWTEENHFSNSFRQKPSDVHNISVRER